MPSPFDALITQELIKPTYKGGEGIHIPAFDEWTPSVDVLIRLGLNNFPKFALYLDAHPSSTP
jgi:hypothetical protein